MVYIVDKDATTRRLVTYYVFVPSFDEMKSLLIFPDGVIRERVRYDRKLRSPR